MALIEETLFGMVDRVAIALARLRQLEPPDGYFLAFSGGKDSVVLYRLAEMAGVRFDAHYNITTVDPPELVHFIRDAYPEVARDRPPVTMWQAILDRQTFPSRQRRFCCEELEEWNGHGRVILTGIRWAESHNRAKRRMVETCYRDSTRSFLHPIIDWSTEDVWAFIRQEHVPYCSLYDEGWKRIGCVLCPMSDRAKVEIERWPKIAAQYRRTFDRLLAAGRMRGKEFTWQDGEALLRWWTSRRAKGRQKNQPVLFE